MDDFLDIQRDKYMQWKEQQRIAMQDYCESCCDHNNKCPYYDVEEESWDYEECFRDRGD